jgi:hypothetical protein
MNKKEKKSFIIFLLCVTPMDINIQFFQSLKAYFMPRSGIIRITVGETHGNNTKNRISPERVEYENDCSTPSGLEINMEIGFPRVAPAVIHIQHLRC